VVLIIFELRSPGIGLHPYSNSTGDPDWGGVASFDWFRRIR